MQMGTKYTWYYHGTSFDSEHAKLYISGVSDVPEAWYKGTQIWGKVEQEPTPPTPPTPANWWTLENGLLTISVTGDMPDEDPESNKPPWYSDRNNVQNVVIEPGATSILSYTFYGHHELTVVTIPDSVTTIGDHAFAGCSALTDVYYGGSRTQWNAITIDSQNEPLTNAEIHFGVREIVADGDWWTLFDDGTLNVHCTGDMPIAPESGQQYSQYIPWYTYKDSVTSLKIENTVTNIFQYAFCDCGNLNQAEIPDSVTAIGQAAFANTGTLNGMRFPSDVSSIPDYCFEGSALTMDTLSIPNTITSIGAYAFRYCDNIHHLILPSSIQTLSSGQFVACSGLSDVVFAGIVTLNGSFTECASLTWVYFPLSIQSISMLEFFVQSASAPSFTNLTDIYYAGTPAQWNNVNNSMLGRTSITVHFNSSIPSA